MLSKKLYFWKVKRKYLWGRFTQSWKIWYVSKKLQGLKWSLFLNKFNWFSEGVPPQSSVDLDEGSFLTFVFSKVAIFGYLWKTFKVQSTNIHFTFELQRSLKTKTLKPQRVLQKPLSGTMLTPLLTHLQPPLKIQ